MQLAYLVLQQLLQ